MGWRRYDYRGRGHESSYGFFPKSTPREAKGGIKAQSKRGTFGESWWAKRWIQVLESFNIGARLGRGRSYARRGQVLSIDIAQGRVKAAVQGSRPTPYRVTIEVKTLSKADWQKLAAELGRQAIFAAKLLAGDMPQDIEEVFRAAKLSLFPEKMKDLTTDCSCPDWSNPCKHIAAVYYLLGEEFDRDPFLIFRLRGVEREELIGLIGAGEASPAKPGRKKRASKVKAEPLETQAEPEPLPGEPLPGDPAMFWRAPEPAADFPGEVRIPPMAAALPKRLGPLPFWRGGTKFLDAMESIYAGASPVALDVFLGQQPGGDRGCGPT